MVYGIVTDGRFQGDPVSPNCEVRARGGTLLFLSGAASEVKRSLCRDDPHQEMH